MSELAERLLDELRARANPENVAGMARFGISSTGTLGVTVADVRTLARAAKREIKSDAQSDSTTAKRALHELAAELWSSGVHEARIMGTVLEVPELMTVDQAERWVTDLDSWDTCDQLCGNALWKAPFAWDLPSRWCVRPETYVKRAGLVVATQLGGKDKAASDERVIGLLSIVEPACFDERNFVKKAASWALRNIGQRNLACHAAAIESAERLLAAVPARGGSEPEKAARWVARDALRELRSDAVLARLAGRGYS